MADITVADLGRSQQGDIKEFTSGLTSTDFLPLEMRSVREETEINFCSGGISKTVAWVNGESAEGGGDMQGGDRA